MTHRPTARRLACGITKLDNCCFLEDVLARRSVRTYSLSTRLDENHAILQRRIVVPSLFAFPEQANEVGLSVAISVRNNARDFVWCCALRLRYIYIRPRLYIVFPQMPKQVTKVSVTGPSFLPPIPSSKLPSGSSSLSLIVRSLLCPL